MKQMKVGLPCAFCTPVFKLQMPISIVALQEIFRNSMGSESISLDLVQNCLEPPRKSNILKGAGRISSIMPLRESSRIIVQICHS